MLLIKHLPGLVLTFVFAFSTTLDAYAQSIAGGSPSVGSTASFNLASLAVYHQSGVELIPNSASGCLKVTPVLAPGNSYGEFAYSLESTNGSETVLIHGCVYTDGSVNAKIEYANTTSANAYFAAGGDAASQAGWRGFWSNYWYYLTNPSAMDDDLETGFYVAMGTSAVAGTAAGGFAIAGVNPVLWGGGATIATGAATTGTAAIETVTIEGVTYQVVTINSAYPGTVLVPNGWSISQMGNTVWGVGTQVQQAIANPTVYPWMTGAWATSWANYYQWVTNNPAFANNPSAPSRLQLMSYYEGLLHVLGM
ncbi:MAG: hypothetical protein FJ308_21460 [Planctomycetes bacterium]|nr:hypothetical protein [Planctomycetota bacterium]